MRIEFHHVTRALRRTLLLQTGAALLALTLSLPAQAQELRALMIGGGPNPEHNQIAIESNVRYLLRLLPKEASRTVLYADGDPKHETVLYEGREKPLTPAERMLALLLEGRNAAHPVTLKYRAPQVGALQGAARKPDIEAAFNHLAEQQAGSRPLLLYFTGHGSPARNRDLDNNVYDLWENGTLSVRELAAHVAKLPAEQPITLVMVQCYSGAFGNLLFENGDPQAAPVNRDIVGFFATVKERVAAGCTPAVDESEYHDFTSYFFAALTGKDRVGRRVKGADYDGNGKVEMNEAYCYALIHDTSIDVPVCTSDVLLRRVVTGLEDVDLFKTPYNSAKSWASPAQRAALEELSQALKLSGDNRGQVAYDRFRGQDATTPRTNQLGAARRAFGQAREEARRVLLGRWPDLTDKSSSEYARSRTGALEMVDRQIKEGKFKELLDADAALDAAEESSYKSEIADALQTRFVRLFKTVVLTHTLRTGNDSANRQRLERLLAAESRPLFAPITVAKK